MAGLDPCRVLQIDCVQGCDDKVAELDKILSKSNLTMEQAAFVGNDINDLSCLKSVGLPIVVKDSHREVFPYARHCTLAPGGYGAVREICDLFVEVLTREV